MRIRFALSLGLCLVFLTSCECEEDITTDKVVDIDGNIYYAVTIGNQTWLNKNLNVTHYRNNDPIPYVTDNSLWSGLSYGAYSEWDNSIFYQTAYGLLYNWYAINDTRGVCPTGWHVPTDAEWYTLENYIDPTVNDPLSVNWRGTNVGTKLKATTGWIDNGSGTDEYGFSGLPGGYRKYDGTYWFLGHYAYWWTSDENSSTEAWKRSIFNEDYTSNRNANAKTCGFSIRCIKD